MNRFRAVLSAAALTFLSACGGPTAPSPADALSASAATAHIDFHFSQGDAVDTAHQEAFHVWVVAELGVAPPQRLQYNKYRDRAHMERVTGKSTNGFAEPEKWAAHVIWPWDPHEATHVYTALIGRPSDFFNEGIAVALSYDPMEGRFVSLWNSTPIDDIARNQLRSGTLPPVASIADTDNFRKLPDQTSYPAAGSFVTFVLRERGMAAMKAFFQASSRDDSVNVIQARFTTAFGWTLAEADQRWRVFLAG